MQHHTAKLTINQLQAFYQVLQTIQEEEHLNDVKELARLTLRPLTNRVHARTWILQKQYSIRINAAERIALRLYQANLTGIYDFSVVQAVIEPILRR